MLRVQNRATRSSTPTWSTRGHAVERGQRGYDALDPAGLADPDSGTVSAARRRRCRGRAGSSSSKRGLAARRPSARAPLVMSSLTVQIASASDPELRGDAVDASQPPSRRRRCGTCASRRTSRPEVSEEIGREDTLPTWNRVALLGEPHRFARHRLGSSRSPRDRIRKPHPVDPGIG